MQGCSYFITARDVRNGSHGSDPTFGTEPAPSHYLRIAPDREEPRPSDGLDRESWMKYVLAEAGREASGDREQFGNVLLFIHGYNNHPRLVLARHRQLAADLKAMGFPGVLVSFDWPSGDLTLGYMEDRGDAKKTAIQLVTDGVLLLAEQQRPDCRINVHVLAHSMGSYVLREAFDDADDRGALAGKNWVVNQVMLIGGDVSARSLGEDPRSSSLYRHSVRLTNYQNRHDRVLGLSNVKRVGVAPRVGRWGLPDDAPGQAINVNCSDHWKRAYDGEDKAGGAVGTSSGTAHSWHFGDPVFTRDLMNTMLGVDRMSMETREYRPDGSVHLKAA